MPFANINGQNIHYEDSGGSGPPVILSHGFLMDQTMFDAQVAVLAPRFRVIRWDERCFGRTEEDGKPFTYWDSAKDCLGLLDHLGLSSAAIGGMSQGGYLSLRAALLAPERIKALVLISTDSAVDDAATAAGHRQLIDTWEKVGPIDPLVEAVGGLILGPRGELWDKWTPRWRALSKERLVLSGNCLVGRDDVSARLGEIRCPAIVFHGDGDQAIPLARGRAMYERLPGEKRFVLVEGAAHATNLTHPQVVNGPLIEFLAKYA
jgi:3-oxoadipate enol-lactonase